MSLTKIDWLAFRTQSDVLEAVEGIRASFGPFGSLIRVKHRKHGWRGFEQSADLCIEDMHIGLMAYGGENQKGWLSVNISGRGCAWVSDWEKADFDLAQLPAFESRRVDIALDTFKREVTHEVVLDAYRAGLFTTAGRPPKLNQILPEEAKDGRTIYVGQRDQAKFLRAYEKGFELVKAMKETLDVTHIDSVPIADIYRLELELKPKNTPLPVDLISKRDQYFAGAYPYLQSVIAVEPEVFSQVRERGPQLDLEAALSHIRHQYGTTLFTALAAYGGDVGAVWEMIVGKKHNDTLLQKGVLLVNH